MAHSAWTTASTIALAFVPIQIHAEAHSYEDRALQSALKAHQLCPLDEASLSSNAPPESTFVELHRDPVFIEEERFPTWPNALHTRTHRKVLLRELRQEVGEPLAREKLAESERNLRGLGIFALVQVVAVERCDIANRAGVFIYTRDLWSLRLETDFRITGSVVDRLLLNLVERNLAGRRQSLAGTFLLEADAHESRISYATPRSLAHDLAIASAASVIARRGGGIEGGALSASLGRPFYHLRQRWAWTALVAVRREVARNLTAGQVRLFDAPDTTETEALPEAWQDDSYALRSGAGYRWHHRGLWQLDFGAELRGRRIRDRLDPSTAEAARSAFADTVLPAERRELGPYAALLWLTPDFHIFRNLDTYGQSEVVRAGPSLEVGIRSAIAQPLSLERAALPYLVADYDLAGRDWLLQQRFSASVRIDPDGFVNQTLGGRVRVAAPYLGWIRPVAELSVRHRNRDENNTLTTLGGDAGLRGYASQALGALGASRAQGGVELRSQPLVWDYLHLGFVAFYDAGALFGASLDHTAWGHSAGLGLRVLFPQANRLPFAFEGGQPFNPVQAPRPVLYSAPVIGFTNPSSRLRLAP